MEGRKKAIVIGLDGATWELLRILLDKGLLPSLQGIVRDGIESTLSSTLPPASAPAWTSLVTGRNPGKHGIYDFLKYENGHEAGVVTSKDIRCPTFYEMMSEHNLKTVLINLPVSYPPKDMKGIIVGDWMAPKVYAYPESASSYINNYRQMYKVQEDGRKGIFDVLDLEERRFEVAKNVFLNEDWDLFFVIFSGTDWLSHRFFPDMKQGNGVGELARRVFILVDSAIGWFIESMDQDTMLLVISEHGFHTYEGSFRINSWLEKQGWLTRGKSEKSRGSNRLNSGAKDGGILNRGNKIVVPERILEMITRFPRIAKWARRIQNIAGKRLNSTPEWAIDIDDSQAFVPSVYGCGVHINRELVTEVDHINKLTDDIIRKMRDVRDEKDEKVFDIVERGEDFYTGDGSSGAPDIVFWQNDKWWIDRSLPLSENNDNFFIKRSISSHHPKGVFLAYGSGIGENGGLSAVDIYDIAPTLLYYFGLTIPKEMDGRPLIEILSGDKERNKPKSESSRTA